MSGLIRLVLALQVEASFPKEVIESALVSGQKHDRHTPDLTSKENLHQHVAPCQKAVGPRQIQCHCYSWFWVDRLNAMTRLIRHSSLYPAALCLWARDLRRGSHAGCGLAKARSIEQGFVLKSLLSGGRRERQGRRPFFGGFCKASSS